MKITLDIPDKPTPREPLKGDTAIEKNKELEVHE